MSGRKHNNPTALQIEFVCPKCGKHLAWALPTTIISCPQCGKWVTKKNRKIQNEVFLPTDSNQLVLFPDF